MVQFTAAAAGIALKSGRIPNDDSKRGNIFRDNASCADNRAFPDRKTAEDGRTGPDRGAFLNGRPLKNPSILAVTARKTVINENRVGADKHVIFKSDAVPNGNMVLERDVIADDGTFFRKASVANIAMTADDCAFENVDKCPDARAFADFGVRMDQGFVVFEVSHNLGADTRHKTQGTK